MRCSAKLCELGADAAVRVIVLRGSGKHFCVGAEIGAATPAAEGPRTTIPALCLELDSGPEADRRARPRRLHRRRGRARLLLRRRAGRRHRVLRATGGAARLCAGAAHSLLSARDRGCAACAAICCRASASPPGRPSGLDLVHELCDAEAAEAALARLLDELLLAGPNAVAQAKGLLLRLAQTPPSRELLPELQREFEQCFRSPEAAEGRASFREKRKPRWFPP